MIKIIGRKGCTNCLLAKKELTKDKVQFEYLDLDTLDNKEELIAKAEKRGIRALPFFIKDGEIVTKEELKDNTLKITKRNGEVKNFDKHRIINAINNAIFETGEIDNNLAITIADEILEESKNHINVEEIQDIIVEKLKRHNRKDVAKRYMEYRKKKAKEREIKNKLDTKEGLLSDEFISQYKHKKPPFTPLGEFVYYRTYSRWLEELGRREYWWETVKRVVEYNCSLLPTSKEEAQRLYDNMFNLKQFPSGRSLWIAGTKSAEEFPLANFNCSFVVIDSFDKFCEQFHALLVGAGVGFRVLLEDVEKMPIPRTDIEIIHKPYKSIKKRYRDEITSLHIKQNNAIIEIGDAKQGWIKALKFYFDILTDKDYKGIKTITFDYDNVRPYGEKLVTFGGRASGHESMKNMITKIDKVIKNRNGKLKPIDCIDISNIIAENVVVGGTRRSAEIGLIDANDIDSIQAKSNLYTQVDDKWIENKEILHRRMSNNTIVYEERPTREQLHWNLEQMRYSGEPAFMNMKEAKKRNPNAKGLNPCAR